MEERQVDHKKINRQREKTIQTKTRKKKTPKQTKYNK
jgi:hypothetical protein